MYRFSTAPQSIGGVLDSGFKLFQAAFKETWALAFVAALLSAPLALLGPGLSPQGPRPSEAAFLVIAFLVILPISLTLYAAIIARIDAIGNGRELSLGGAIRYGARRGAPMFVAGLLFGCAILVGLILLVVPGIILMVMLVFGVQIAVTERLGPVASLKYSAQLVRGHWWRTAALLTVIGIIVAVIYTILTFVVAIVAGLNAQEIAATGRLPWYIDFVLTPLMAAVTGPLAYSMIIATFYDLKNRREGGDIAERIAAATT
ncbi:MAG TPA: hypothetical protein VFV10_03570 [Gammaproteobacteria bacterium]|nr:hypothetical protein [Gammaproteobacteria bacterium]